RAFDWYVIELIFSQGIPANTQTWINVTGHTVKDEDFSDRFTEMMQRHSIAPDSIAIEVTEQAAGNGAERHLSTLHTRTGVAIVVDDFGSGYSNLLALLRLPLYAVKIDGKLVRAYRNPHVAAVIKAAAMLGREWEVLLVAEWVEDLTMLKTLQCWDVTGFQGFAVR
ncbi:MAG TPA: EAL domain-containing protein, partial [Candidatus Paceibacterota bacterium]|nr:EAL domain-containing protein [Candidatus Paceibacterota bacterium]